MRDPKIKTFSILKITYSTCHVFRARADVYCLPFEQWCAYTMATYAEGKGPTLVEYQKYFRRCAKIFLTPNEQQGGKALEDDLAISLQNGDYILSYKV
jgi:hypothetical protein